MRKDLGSRFKYALLTGIAGFYLAHNLHEDSVVWSILWGALVVFWVVLARWDDLDAKKRGAR